MIVVVPSNRALDLDHLEPLIESGARFIVVDDSEGSITVDHPRFTVCNWQDRRRLLSDLDVGFPRRNGACRDVGFYLAWKESDPGEIIGALDDDCAVHHEDFAAQVEEALSDRPRPVAGCEGDHLNILDCYAGVSPQLFPRGFPYSARAGYAGTVFGPEARREATFSLGLWKNVFDVNAIDKIEGPPYVHPDARLTHPSVTVAPGKLVSVCSMNMHFRRGLVPAAYQLPMHVEVMPGWVVDRYGDIWGGFVLKTLMDLRGEAMAVGEPMITHLKEGDYRRNLWQEHVCHLVNDEFLALLAEARSQLAPDSYLEMMKALREVFAKGAETASPLLAPYLRHLATAMHAWNRALEG